MLKKSYVIIAVIAVLITTGIALADLSNGLGNNKGKDNSMGNGFTGGFNSVHEDMLKAYQKEGGEVNWILPGYRELDPEIFGDVENPLGFEEGIGVPVNARENDSEGNWTTTSFPTPFSDNYDPIEGSFDTWMVDKTPVDQYDGSTPDYAQGVFKFTSPDDSMEYTIVLKHVLPNNPESAHPFLGGVVIDGWLHGKTSVGTRLMPTVYTYGSFWGMAELYVDNGTEEKCFDNVMLHVMTTEDTRNEDYELMIDSELEEKRKTEGLGIDTHVMVPPGAVPEDAQYEIMPGMKQPFLHIMYEDTDLRGTEIFD
ncbi:MAG: hypothetical protein R6U44_03390 [Archaeoglobaceae archaeon]